MSRLSYAEKLRDPRWQRKRLAVFERDDFTCRDCRAKDRPLHVHHCLYEKGDPWDTDNKFLLTLCDACHDFRQAYENDTKRAVGIIFERLNPEELREFATSAVHFASSKDHDAPQIRDGLEIEWLSEVRWYHQAIDHKPLRKTYEEVIGCKPSWKFIDDRRRSRNRRKNKK